MNRTYEELDNAAETDYRLFWRLLRKKSAKSIFICKTLEFDNKKYVDNEVVNGFKQYFSKIFRNEESDNYFSENIKNKLESLKLGNIDEYSYIIESDVTPTELSKIIRNLKKRKSPGNDFPE